MFKKAIEILIRYAFSRRISFYFLFLLIASTITACHPCQITSCGPDVLPVSVSIENNGEIYIHILAKDPKTEFELESLSITKENEPYPQAYYFSYFSKHKGPPQKLITKDSPIKYGELYPNQKQEFGPKKS